MRDRRERALHGRIEADGEVVVLLAQPLLVLEAKTVVQRELRADAPVVLGVSAEVVREDVERRRDRQRRVTVGPRRWVAEQERGERVAVRRAADAAVGRGHVLVEIEKAGAVARDERVDAHLPPVAAELERVRAGDFRQRGVRAGGLPVDFGRVDRAERARPVALVVAADPDLGKLVQLNLVLDTSCENGRLRGSKSMVIVSLSGNSVFPNRSASTDVLLSTQVLFSARICGRRRR